MLLGVFVTPHRFLYPVKMIRFLAVRKRMGRAGENQMYGLSERSCSGQVPMPESDTGVKLVTSGSICVL